MNAQFISINSDVSKNYLIDGIVTVNIDSNFAVIKLKEKENNIVELGNIDNVNVEDGVITISSKTGLGMISQLGIVVSKNKYIQTSIPLLENDQGSPVFNVDGKVIGMNTAQSINSDVSTVIPCSVLQDVQDKFNNVNFDEIKAIPFNTLKEKFYYVKYNTSVIQNSIPENYL